MRHFSLITCLLFISIFAFMFGCGEQGPPSEITFSHILSARSEWHVGATQWKERVEAETENALSIRIVTNASLSNNNQRNELEMVQAGTLGGSFESSILLTIVDKRWTVWSLPWMFDSYKEAEIICESKLGREMLKSLEAKGIVGLAYGFNGFRRLTNARSAITDLPSIKNLKVRIPSLQMFISLYRLWGADPSQMNFGDLMVALKEGAMDGQENPLHVITSTGLYDLQPHLTLWEYSFDPIIYCVSKRVWDRLPEDQQIILRMTAELSARIQRKTVIENEQMHLEVLKANGVTITIPTPDAIEQFKKASRPIYAEYKEAIGDELLDLFMQATQADRTLVDD